MREQHNLNYGPFYGFDGCGSGRSLPLQGGADYNPKGSGVFMNFIPHAFALLIGLPPTFTSTLRVFMPTESMMGGVGDIFVPVTVSVCTTEVWNAPLEMRDVP